MGDALKLPPLAREVASEDIQVRVDEKVTRIKFSASSETPIERWFGEEVLSHEGKAVRLDRVKRGAMPLLFNHDPSDPVGIIDAARIEDKRLVVEAHLFDTARANEVAAMLRGGLKNVSIGYRLHVVEEDKKTNTFTARDWEPFEASIVTVPADPTVGIGRSMSGEELEVRHGAGLSTPAESAITERKPSMSSKTAVELAAEAEAAEKQAAATSPQSRPRRSAARQSSRCARPTRSTRAWKRAGSRTARSSTTVAKELYDVMEERGQAAPGQGVGARSHQERDGALQPVPCDPRAEVRGAEPAAHAGRLVRDPSARPLSRRSSIAS